VAALSVDIVSDTICPWCWLGKRRFELARARRPDLEIAVRWQPFQLDPSLPPEGASHHERLVRKLGGAARLEAAHARLAEMGRAVGIDYAFDRIVKTPNTLPAHVLVRRALSHGGPAVQDALVERLFRGFFAEGRDLTREETLVELAGEAGLPADEAREALADASARAAVSAEVARWQEAGVTGVPTFVFADQFAVSGAQDPDTFVQMLARVAPQVT
jgi:predicted DsbA family dithiol-disulfide isomerase